MVSDGTKRGVNRVSSDPNRPAYDNPVGNKGELVAGNNVLSDEAKGHPDGGQHSGKQRAAGQHGQRPVPAPPQQDDSDKKRTEKSVTDD